MGEQTNRYSEKDFGFHSNHYNYLLSHNTRTTYATKRRKCSKPVSLNGEIRCRTIMLKQAVHDSTDMPVHPN